jgi:uncharacterized membrane protein
MALFNTLINFLKLSSLVVIIGSTITIGAIVAPIVFKSLVREEAGKLMIDVFGRYDAWLNIAVIVLLISSLLKFFLLDKMLLSPQSLISLALVLIIVSISFYSIYVLSPQILTAYQAHAENFQSLHVLSEKIHKMNFLLGLIVLIFT